MLYRYKSFYFFLFGCFVATQLCWAQNHQSLYKSALEKIQNQQEISAIEDLQQAILLKPDFLKAYEKLIDVYIENKTYDKALALIDKAIAIKPNSSSYFSRGYANDKLKNYTASIADYNKVLESRPKYACAFNNRAIVYQHLKMYDNAMADFKKVLDLDDNFHSFVNTGLALLYEELGDYQNAIMHYNEAILQDPNDVKLYGHAKGIMNFSPKWKQIPALKQQDNWANTYYDAFTEKGAFLMRLGKYHEAISCFQQSLSVNPNNQFALANWGLCLWFLGKEDESKKYLQPINKAYNCFQNANLYALHQQNNKALECIDIAFKNSNFNNEHLHLNRAFLLLKKGLFKEAIDDCNAFLKIDSTSSEVYNLKGYANFMMGNIKEALMDENNMLLHAKPTFQPVFQYAEAAKKAEKNSQAFYLPTQIIWMQPTKNVNDLLQKEVLLPAGLIKLKLLIMHQNVLQKDAIKLYVESDQKIDADITTDLIELPKEVNQKYMQYQWNGMVKLPKGKYTIYVECNGIFSQKLLCVAE
ncbi:MAG: tetratricopeptide repeat protein [Chitinophagaceae bacterium]